MDRCGPSLQEGDGPPSEPCTRLGPDVFLVNGRKRQICASGLGLVDDIDVRVRKLLAEVAARPSRDG
jgi:hypothetical protein